MKKELLYEEAKRRAFSLLAARARSKHELKRKLEEKGFDLEVIEAVIQRLHELGYLNDGSFARQLSRHLGVNKLYSNKKIEFNLREKGISKHIIVDTLTDLREEINESQALQTLIDKKIKMSGNMNNQEKRRLIRNLIGKGFPPDLVFEMIRRSKEDFLE